MWRSGDRRCARAAGARNLVRRARRGRSWRMAVAREPMRNGSIGRKRFGVGARRSTREARSRRSSAMRLCLLAALLSTATAYIALRAHPRTAINPRIAAPPRLATSDSFSPLSIFEDLPEDAEKPFSLLLFSQFVLFVGVGAVIPTIPLYGKAIGLTGASTGVVIAAPALALLLAVRSRG